MISKVCENILRAELQTPELCLGRDRYWLNVRGRKEGQEVGERKEGTSVPVNLRPPQCNPRNCQALAVLSVVWHRKSFPGQGSRIKLSVSLGKKARKGPNEKDWEVFWFFVFCFF